MPTCSEDENWSKIARQDMTQLHLIKDIKLR